MLIVVNLQSRGSELLHGDFAHETTTIVVSTMPQIDGYLRCDFWLEGSLESGERCFPDK